MKQMLPAYHKVKGVHPGAVLKRELLKRKLKSIELAKAINEYPQTINAITKERRGVNAKLSIKLANYFNIENEYFMLLQSAYEINQLLSSEHQDSLKGRIRTALFWDTDFDKINWQKHKRFVIKRILERGSPKEIKALISFYTLPIIKAEIQKIEGSFLRAFEKNVAEYIEI